ncbi:MAG: hypothetical protein J1F40_01460 [Prevotellaceae bacterium]|nr:hypothetical protein [Prevotellaceae bacterium]
MTKTEFQHYIDKYADVISQIKESAHALHASVNQTYDGDRPYGFHLDMVADSVYKYGHVVCTGEQDILPMFFGTYYHDSIEDACLTYNDVMRIAKRWMGDDQSLTAAEIVYALTNDKGRTRAERAGEKYYQGIRETAFAPFIKLCDRLANITYSFTHGNEDNARMKQVYQSELPHFLESIDAKRNDIRYALPEEMINAIETIVNKT